MKESSKESQYHPQRSLIRRKPDVWRMQFGCNSAFELPLLLLLLLLLSLRLIPSILRHLLCYGTTIDVLLSSSSGSIDVIIADPLHSGFRPDPPGQPGDILLLLLSWVVGLLSCWVVGLLVTMEIPRVASLCYIHS